VAHGNVKIIENQLSPLNQCDCTHVGSGVQIGKRSLLGSEPRRSSHSLLGLAQRVRVQAGVGSPPLNSRSRLAYHFKSASEKQNKGE